MNTDQQTADSFRDKWRNNQDLAFAETLRAGSDIYNWILGRNGFNSAAEFQGWLSSRHRILDAGCGNGRVTALLHDHSFATCEIVGADLTAADIAADNLSERCESNGLRLVVRTIQSYDKGNANIRDLLEVRLVKK